MDPHHRRIDLQSPADLTYLLSNIQATAAQKLDEAIPRSAAPAGEDDAYRRKVDELVQEYILSTLHLALPNLSINGFDASPSLLPSAPSHHDPTSTANHSGHDQSKTAGASAPSDEDIATGNYEPYDPRLAERLRALYVQLEHESEDVSRMRREIPKRAADSYIESLKAQVEKLEGGEVKMEEDGGEVKMEGDGMQGAEVEGEGLRGLGARQEEVERMWKRGREGLEGLEAITGVIGRLEQAGKAVEVVEGR